jgi:hypothetical protein
LRVPAIPVPGPELTEWNKLLSDIQKMTLSRFLDEYAQSERPLSYWINLLILWESEQKTKGLVKFKLRPFLQNFEEMEIFHQPTATKWTFFYFFVRENLISDLG